MKHKPPVSGSKIQTVDNTKIGDNNRIDGAAQASKSSGIKSVFNKVFGKFGNERASEPPMQKSTEEHARKKASYAALTTVDDWKAELLQHSEWAGHSPMEMAQDKKTGASAFYAAFGKWCKKHYPDLAARRKLTSELFDRKTISYAHLTTIDGWKEEFTKHSNWAGRSPTEMINDHETGAHSFYTAFGIWCQKKYSNPAERRKLTRELFCIRTVSYSALKTIEDWRDEFAKHPDWAGLSLNQMRESKDVEASGFRGAFYRWTETQTTDKKARKMLRQELTLGERTSGELAFGELPLEDTVLANTDKRLVAEYEKERAGQNAANQAYTPGQQPKTPEQACEAVQRLLDKGLIKEALSLTNPYRQRLDIIDMLASNAIQLASRGKSGAALRVLDGIKPNKDSGLNEIYMKARIDVHEKLLVNNDTSNAILLEGHTPDSELRSVLATRRLLLDIKSRLLPDNGSPGGNGQIDFLAWFKQVSSEIEEPAVRRDASRAVTAIYWYKVGQPDKVYEIVRNIRNDVVLKLAREVVQLEAVQPTQEVQTT